MALLITSLISYFLSPYKLIDAEYLQFIQNRNPNTKLYRLKDIIAKIKQNQNYDMSLLEFIPRTNYHIELKNRNLNAVMDFRNYYFTESKFTLDKHFQLWYISEYYMVELTPEQSQLLELC